MYAPSSGRLNECLFSISFLCDNTHTHRLIQNLGSTLQYVGDSNFASIPSLLCIPQRVTTNAAHLAAIQGSADCASHMAYHTQPREYWIGVIRLHPPTHGIEPRNKQEMLVAVFWISCPLEPRELP